MGHKKTETCMVFGFVIGLSFVVGVYSRDDVFQGQSLSRGAFIQEPIFSKDTNRQLLASTADYGDDDGGYNGNDGGYTGVVPGGGDDQGIIGGGGGGDQGNIGGGGGGDQGNIGGGGDGDDQGNIGGGAAGGSNGSGDGTLDRINGQCSKENICINQGQTPPLPNGIPTYTVQIQNLCVSGRCSISNVHLRCGWFSSARLINPAIFRRLSYNDCLVKNGNPINPGEMVSFQYANTYPYPMSVSSVSCY